MDRQTIKAIIMEVNWNREQPHGGTIVLHTSGDASALRDLGVRALRITADLSWDESGNPSRLECKEADGVVGAYLTPADFSAALPTNVRLNAHAVCLYTGVSIPAGTKVHLTWTEPSKMHTCEVMRQRGGKFFLSENGDELLYSDGRGGYLHGPTHCPCCGKQVSG